MLFQFLRQAALLKVQAKSQNFRFADERADSPGLEVVNHSDPSVVWRAAIHRVRVG